jgi:hypothetical protein
MKAEQGAAELVAGRLMNLRGLGYEVAEGQTR